MIPYDRRHEYLVSVRDKSEYLVPKIEILIHRNQVKTLSIGGKL